MTKAESIFQSLTLAKEKFKEALSFPDTEPLRESLIQRFEYTIELAWKLMGEILAHEDKPVSGVRNIIRAAAKQGLIDNPEKWLDFADQRNRTSHIYLERIAIEVASSIRIDFLENIEALINSAKKYITKD